VTAFTLLQDYCNGGMDLEFVRWAAGLGANTVRIFGMWSVTGFDPRSTIGYYESLDVLCMQLEILDLRLHFVAFTDQVPGSSVLMSSDEQTAHLRRVVDVLSRHDNVLLEYVNEDWKNGGIAHRWISTNEILTTRSSWEDGNTPLEVGSVLDYTTEHTPRGDGWERKSKNLLETSRLGMGEEGEPDYFRPTNKPAIAGEPERLQNATPRQYADYVAVAELFASGACLHGDGDTLQRCRIPADQSVAQAVAAVWASPPPADLAAVGTYVRGQKDGGGPCPIAHSDDLALRTFAMVAGNRATAVVVSPRPGWSLQPVNGWRVARQYGFEGNCIDLER
jgi:hypothetical protein